MNPQTHYYGHRLYFDDSYLWAFCIGEIADPGLNNFLLSYGAQVCTRLF